MIPLPRRPSSRIALFPLAFYHNHPSVLSRHPRNPLSLSLSRTYSFSTPSLSHFSAAYPTSTSPLIALHASRWNRRTMNLAQHPSSPSRFRKRLRRLPHLAKQTRVLDYPPSLPHPSLVVLPPPPSPSFFLCVLGFLFLLLPRGCAVFSLVLSRIPTLFLSPYEKSTLLCCKNEIVALYYIRNSAPCSISFSSCPLRGWIVSHSLF